MKKILLYTVVFIVCSILIVLSVKSGFNSLIDNKVISIFQTGVYKTYDEALVSCDDESKIYFDGNLYHVYDAITTSDSSTDKMIDYYKDNNVDFYIKEKYVDNETYDSLKKYTTLLNLSDEDTLKIINKQILEKFGKNVL